MASRFEYVATYIVTNRPRGVLYIGSTNSLARRAWEHREGLVEGFTSRYRCTRLAWYEPHDLMTEAIRRELAIKHWLRAWKVELIEAINPEWDDLYLTLN